MAYSEYQSAVEFVWTKSIPIKFEEKQPLIRFSPLALWAFTIVSHSPSKRCLFSETLLKLKHFSFVITSGFDFCMNVTTSKAINYGKIKMKRISSASAELMFTLASQCFINILMISQCIVFMCVTQCLLYSIKCVLPVCVCVCDEHARIHCMCLGKQSVQCVWV